MGSRQQPAEAEVAVFQRDGYIVGHIQSVEVDAPIVDGGHQASGGEEVPMVALEPGVKRRRKGNGMGTDAPMARIEDSDALSSRQRRTVSFSPLLPASSNKFDAFRRQRLKDESMAEAGVFDQISPSPITGKIRILPPSRSNDPSSTMVLLDTLRPFFEDDVDWELMP